MLLAIKILGGLLLITLSLTALYFLLVFIGTIIPKNFRYSPHKKGIPIYLISNGVHADFLLPPLRDHFDWWSILDFKDFTLTPPSINWIAFGWGDRGFYLDTPTWAELKFKTAVNAALLPSPTVMHITTYTQAPIDTYKFYQQLWLSTDQYHQLCQYIHRSFRSDPQNGVHLIPDVGYTVDDNFYLANGVYHAFNTCNSWVNTGLKHIGIRSAMWTPFDKGIFYQLKKIKD